MGEKPGDFMQQLNQVHLIDNELITLSYEEPWHQEDIQLLINLLLPALGINEAKETIEGADRVNARIEFQQAILVINFEVYSQSCWIEAEQNQYQTQLMQAYTLLQALKNE